MADRLRTLGDVAGSGCRGTGTKILLCLYLGSPGSARTLRIYGLVYRYAEHAYSDDGIADTECGEHRSLSAAGLCRRYDGRRCGARNGHCPMVGIPDGMSVLSHLLSPVKQV